MVRSDLTSFDDRRLSHFPPTKVRGKVPVNDLIVLNHAFYKLRMIIQ